MNKLYATAFVREKNIVFTCGTKHVTFTKDFERPIVIENKNILYKGITYKSVLDQSNNKKQIFISFTDEDIIFESMKIIEIKRCDILNYEFINVPKDSKFVFDKDMNLFPVLHYDKYNPKSIKLTTIGNGDYIEFRPNEECSKVFEFASNVNDFDINVNGNVSLTMEQIKSKFIQSGILEGFSYSLSFFKVSDIYPMFRSFSLNKILYKRFKDKYKIQNKLSKAELEVIDLAEIDDIQILDKDAGEINVFQNCTIWDITKTDIIEHKIDDINNFDFGRDDKIHYLVLPLSDEYEWQRKYLKGFYVNHKSYKYLVLVQVSKNNLKQFKTVNIIEKLNGRTRINNNINTIV